MVIAVLWLVAVYVLFGLTWVAFATIVGRPHCGGPHGWADIGYAIVGWPYCLWVKFGPRTHNLEATLIIASVAICGTLFALLIMNPAHS